MDFEEFKLVCDNFVIIFKYVLENKNVSLNTSPHLEFYEFIKTFYLAGEDILIIIDAQGGTYKFSWNSYKNKSLEVLFLELLGLIEEHSSPTSYYRFWNCFIIKCKESQYYKRNIIDVEVSEEPLDISNLTVDVISLAPKIEKILKKIELARKLMQ